MGSQDQWLQGSTSGEETLSCQEGTLQHEAEDIYNTTSFSVADEMLVGHLEVDAEVLNNRVRLF